MIILNVGYSRTTRKPHRKRRIEYRNVTGIRLLGYWNIDNGPDIRSALNVHPRKPDGKGWSVCGYAWVGGGDKANAGAVPRRGSDVGTSPLLGQKSKED